jgi:hypothetical protein
MKTQRYASLSEDDSFRVGSQEANDNQRHPPLSWKPESSSAQVKTEQESWVDESKHIELIGLSIWMATISAFILVNNFVGPWPSVMHDVPERVWFLGHMLGGVFFGGGVLLTTAIEYMVANNSNTYVLQFWFDKVPLLDMAIVLPGLTLSMISGTGLAITHYGSLADAPPHIPLVFWALVVFAAWWAVTDLSTQGGALTAVMEMTPNTTNSDDDRKNNNNNVNENENVKNILTKESSQTQVAPDVVHQRTISNVVSCFLVLVLYAIMVLKPGTIHYW